MVIITLKLKIFDKKIHPTENIIIRLRDEPKSLRTQYQVQNETHDRKNQKVVENKGKLGVKKYPKKTTIDSTTLI